MTALTIHDLCQTYDAGVRDFMLCQIFVNVRPEYTAQQTISRINNRIISLNRARELRHWSYDTNLLIALKQLCTRLEINLKGHLSGIMDS